MMISMWLYGLSRWFRQRFGSKKRTSIDPPLIQILPHVPEYRPNFTIRDQLRKMEESQLPTPEQVADYVESQGETGLLFRNSYTAVLSDLTTPDQRRALFLNKEAFARFDTELRRICGERNVEIVTTTDQDLNMRMVFRKKEG